MGKVEEELARSLLAGIGLMKTAQEEVSALGERFITRGEEVLGAGGIRNEPLRHGQVTRAIPAEGRKPAADNWFASLSDAELNALHEAVEAERARRAGRQP